jgi:ABC-type lipoprotein export system ATPase subunit
LIDFTHDGEPQDVLCIAGVNGSGKTTVMELIFNLVNLLNPNLSVRDISYDRLKSNVLTRVKFAQLDIEINKNILSLVVGDQKNIQKQAPSKQVFIIDSNLGLLISQFENQIVKTPEGEEDSQLAQRLKALIEYTDLSGKLVKKSNIKGIQPLIKKISQALSNDNVSTENCENLPFIYFFNAHDREIHDIRYRSIINEKSKYQLVHRYDPKKDDLKKTLIYYDYAYPDKFEALTKWVNKNILIEKSIDRIDRPNFNVVISTNNKSLHGLELLSSGEESLLILATQIYLRAHQNSVFLIDEIDQSLHPEFQEKIIDLIKNLQKEKNCQIIVSSHSDIIWSQFETRGLIDLTEMVF